jgi:hypothetical protein
MVNDHTVVNNLPQLVPERMEDAKCYAATHM